MLVALLYISPMITMNQINSLFNFVWIVTHRRNEYFIAFKANWGWIREPTVQVCLHGAWFPRDCFQFHRSGVGHESSLIFLSLIHPMGMSKTVQAGELFSSHFLLVCVLQMRTLAIIFFFFLFASDTRIMLVFTQSSNVNMIKKHLVREIKFS